MQELTSYVSCMSTQITHISKGWHMLCKVRMHFGQYIPGLISCAGALNWEIGTAMSCIECSQVVGFIMHNCTQKMGT